MSEKLTESITHKCTDEEKRKLEAIARSRKMSLSELVRFVCIEEISDVEALLNCLQTEFDLTRDTVDTCIDVTPEFALELVPNPEPHFSQAQKKLSCYDQLSIFVPSTKSQ